MRTSSLLTAALLITSSRILLADAWEYEGHRIAASFDGNSAPDKAYKWPTGDPDDWSAAAASFAIMAKLGLQDKLVHVSYNNFIDAPPGPDEKNQLKISREGAAERWVFKNTKIFDVTLQLKVMTMGAPRNSKRLLAKAFLPGHARLNKRRLGDNLVDKDQAPNKLSLEFLSKVHLRACVVHTDLSRIVQ